MASEAAADIERFHRVPIEDEIKRRGIELKLQGAEIVEPCPDNINISSMAAAKNVPRGMRLLNYCGMTTRHGF